MLPHARTVFCMSLGFLLGAADCFSAHPQGSADTRVVSPRASRAGASVASVREFVTASEKSNEARRRLASGHDREAVRLFAESLAELIGVQRGFPHFAPSVVSGKIQEVKDGLERSLAGENIRPVVSRASR